VKDLILGNGQRNGLPYKRWLVKCGVKQIKMRTKAQTDELQDFREAIDALEAGMSHVVYPIKQY